MKFQTKNSSKLETPLTNQPINQTTMDIYVQKLEPSLFDPFEDPRARKLFSPSDASEHPKSAIVRRIDLLREVLSEPDGYKKIILARGGSTQRFHRAR